MAEILVKGGGRVISAVRMMCEKAWEEEKLPTEWTRGIIFPIYKDGEKKDTNNYRGITTVEYCRESICTGDQLQIDDVE